MKKIVPSMLIISSQILIGALFLIFTLNCRSEVKLKVYSKEIVNLSEFVYNERNVVVENSNVSSENKVVSLKEVDTEIELTLDDEEKTIDEYFYNNEVISTYTGILTGYGPDCFGCGNFNTNKVSTASGYHIADIVDGVVQPASTITYSDGEYGEVRIVAGDSMFPYKTIVRITIPNNDPIIAIVLDRGSTVGFENCRSQSGCLTNFDLLFATENEAIGKTYNVKFEILRIGG